MNHKTLYISAHPLIADRLGKMRDADCPPREFRKYMKEIARILAIEATSGLSTYAEEVNTPLCATSVQRLPSATPLIIPILRAGLGISQGFEDILPEADTGHIGLYRDEKTLRPVEYLVKLPGDLNRPIFICDPMLATGHSMEKTIEILLEHGAKVENIIAVTLLCVPEGIALIRKSYPDMPIYTAALDDHLNENAYIVPGLGDAGDRIFGTV